MQLYLPDIVLGNNPQANHLFAQVTLSLRRRGRNKEGEKTVQSLRVWLMDGSSATFLLLLPMFSAFLIPPYPASEKIYLSDMSNYIREFTLCQMELKFSRVIWVIKGWKYYPFILQNIGGKSSTAVNNVLAYSVMRLLPQSHSAYSLFWMVWYDPGGTRILSSCQMIFIFTLLFM